MNNEKRIAELKEEKYQVLFGIQKAMFEAMHAILESAYKEMRTKGGKERRLSVLDMLVITLGYYHDYRTMENIAFDYDCHKQRVSEAVSWVEETLILDGTFTFDLFVFSLFQLINADTRKYAERSSAVS